MNLLLVLIYILTPALVIWLCSRYSFLDKIGPILLLYLIGILLGNSGLLPDTAAKLQDLLVTIMIPIAIPLMLFSCSFKQLDFKNASLTLITGIVAVIIVVIGGYFIFKPLIGEDPLIGNQFHNIAGLLSGVYTGGTPNMAAIKIMLDVPNETYIMVNSYDMAISLIYMIFLFVIGIKLFRKVLHSEPAKESVTIKDMPAEIKQERPYKDFFTKRNFIPLLGAIGLSVLIFAISGGLSFLLPKSVQTVVIILSITTLGIAASFVKQVREIKMSYDAGMYLIYIFSIVVASMADITRLNLTGGIYVLLYVIFIIFGSLALQLIMARFLKLDADTVVIASVALINSAPFVPMVATAMKNKSVIIPGITIGIIGYAIGNYVGYLISKFLFLFG